MGLLRRAFALTALALSFSPHASAHSGKRKTLSFKPPHPGAYFDTSGHGSSGGALDTRDSFEVARSFLDDLLRSPSYSYFIRKDSYTDVKTGVSHIYVRQLIDGLEVADGDINLNIRNGRVLSYGNSFFQEDAKDSYLNVPNWHQGSYCAESTTLPTDPACGDTLDHIRSMASVYNSYFSPSDPRAAVFFFLQAAYPGPTSLIPDISSFKVERHVCTDPVKETTACRGWVITSDSNFLEPVYVRQVYVQTPNGFEASTMLNLAWRLEVTLPDNSYEAYVSVHDPSKIISVVDWVVDAPVPDQYGWLSALERYMFEQVEDYLGIGEPEIPATGTQEPLVAPIPTSSPSPGSYRVWKWGVNDPESGKRTLEKAPSDFTASPLGWHAVPAAKDPLQSHPELDGDEIVNYTTTIGNNVIAQENWDGGSDFKDNQRPNGGEELVFDFPYGADPSEPGWENVQPRQYMNLSVAQLFYSANMYHDLLYQYGFDEASGNFQQHNFGKGGSDNDSVIMHAQDGSGFNNANFLTPPDGQKGRCRMYLWNVANPFRDGGLDAGILIHELSHGLSTRLTGGPADSSCLNTREAGGMGEGWGDFIATLVRSSNTSKDFGIGGWAANAPEGIRHFPYSTNNSRNPSMYDYLQRVDYREVHAIGEVWAEILWVVSSKLIEKHGFAESLFPGDADMGVADFYRTILHPDGSILEVPKHGNTLMLQLIVSGMKTQPCRPTFIQARDAILAVDKALTGGENNCLLWKAFAERGLGTNAKNLTFATRPSINGFNIPTECE